LSSYKKGGLEKSGGVLILIGLQTRPADCVQTTRPVPDFPVLDPQSLYTIKTGKTNFITGARRLALDITAKYITAAKKISP